MQNNVKPIEELFYKKCFSYGRLCIAKSFDKDFHLLLANDIFFYSKRKMKTFIAPYLDYLNAASEEYIMEKELGIIGCDISRNLNICEKIIDELDDGNLILQTLDNFYFPDYSWQYHQKHSLHGFLIYGYDLGRV